MLNKGYYLTFILGLSIADLLLYIHDAELVQKLIDKAFNR
jgi:hypothetical protein